MSLLLANGSSWSSQQIFIPLVHLLWGPPSLCLVIHVQNLRLKVENTQIKFQKVTYQYKRGLIYYKSVVYRSYFHPRSLHTFDCNPSKYAPKFFWLLPLPIYLWMECCRPLQLSVHLIPQCSKKCTNKSGIHVPDDAPSYPKVHTDIFKELFCCFLSIHGIFTRH